MVLLLVATLCFQRSITECFSTIPSHGYRSQRCLSLTDIKSIFSVRINGIQRWYVQVYVHDSYQLNIEVWFLPRSRGRSRFIRITSRRSGCISAAEKITVLQSLHEVCADTVCPEEIFYSKHFSLLLWNCIFMVIIFLRRTKLKYIHQGWRLEKDSKNRDFSPLENSLEIFKNSDLLEASTSSSQQTG